MTGHRRLTDPAVASAVQAALRLIRGEIEVGPATEVMLVAVSALAEGADRLVAREVLAETGGRLEAVLPRHRTEYIEDFAAAASRREFNDLLKRTSHVWQAPSLPTRGEGYEWAGRRVVDRCDVLIAIWDGRPSRGRGGTQK